MTDPQRIVRAMEHLEPGDTITALVDRDVIFGSATAYIAFRATLDTIGDWNWRIFEKGVYSISITKKEQ